ncbi:MAG: hypothetical protein QM786_00500 [Breznakibacter sp.]
MKLYLVLLCGVIWIGEIKAQYNFNRQFTYPEFDESLANTLLMRIENTNFLKNNEYFGDYVEGYTLLGNDVEPSLMYYAGSKVRLKVGAYLRKYSGLDTFSIVKPIISIHAKLSSNLELVMGSLRGSIHHRLIDAVFDSERRYARPVENGVQFLFTSNDQKHWFDVWVDWEQFLWYNGSDPEKLMFGISSRNYLLSTKNQWDITAPVSLLVRHQGGQITQLAAQTVTMMNWTAGLEVEKRFEGKSHKSVGIKSDYIGYREIDDDSTLPFHAGWALHNSLFFDSKKFQVWIGHFYGYNFLAPVGNYLFQSLSSYMPNVYRKNPQLLTLKTGYGYSLLKQLTLDATFDAYYDLINNRMDYSYGLSLVFLPNWRVIKVSME